MARVPVLLSALVLCAAVPADAQLDSAIRLDLSPTETSLGHLATATISFTVTVDCSVLDASPSGYTVYYTMAADGFRLDGPDGHYLGSIADCGTERKLTRSGEVNVTRSRDRLAGTMEEVVVTANLHASRESEILASSTSRLNVTAAFYSAVDLWPSGAGQTVVREGEWPPRTFSSAWEAMNQGNGDVEVRIALLQAPAWLNLTLDRASLALGPWQGAEVLHVLQTQPTACPEADGNYTLGFEVYRDGALVQEGQARSLPVACEPWTPAAQQEPIPAASGALCLAGALALAVLVRRR